MEDFLIIGVDNGSSGSFCILNLYNDNEVYYFSTPIKKERSYTKKEQYFSRVNHQLLKSNLEKIINKRPCKVYMERPMINNTRFNNSLSAIRCLESECIILEQLGIYYEFLDSKNWQKVLLPGIKGRDNLKLESKNLALKLFSQFYKDIKKDGDSFLIAYYIKQKLLRENKEN
jgi:hypothetical protein